MQTFSRRTNFAQHTRPSISGHHRCSIATDRHVRPLTAAVLLRLTRLQFQTCRRVRMQAAHPCRESVGKSLARMHSRFRRA